MNWIIGLDLRPRSLGALHFAGWLRTSAQEEDHRFTAVHVLEPEHLRAALKYHHLDEVLAAARGEGRKILAHEAPADLVEGLELEHGAEATEALAGAAARHAADGLVIGRAAARTQAPIVRLGRVARRLLRRLPAPVVVVPPDVRATDLGGGPVIALTRLDDSASEACRFAARVARATGRRWLLLHVVPAIDLPYLTERTVEANTALRCREAEGALAGWVAREGLAPDETRVEHGDVLACVDEVAREREAPLIVAGATVREGLERLTVPSLGRELAATARVPVAIVPPRS